jgi:hypothetical protein
MGPEPSAGIGRGDPGRAAAGGGDAAGTAGGRAGRVGGAALAIAFTTPAACARLAVLIHLRNASGCQNAA